MLHTSIVADYRFRFKLHKTFHDQCLPYIPRQLGNFVETYMTKGQIESKGYSIMSIGIVLICISFLFMFVGSYFSNPGFSDLISWGSTIMGLSILITVAGVVVRAIEKTPSPQLISPTSQHSVVTKEKETIVKEVVMIPCKYCGGLMPQTSVYCPNCGAKRKA
jgi:hypothetical protein